MHGLKLKPFEILLALFGASDVLDARRAGRLSDLDDFRRIVEPDNGDERRAPCVFGKRAVEVLHGVGLVTKYAEFVLEG